jgi:hypothetical protein
VLFLTTKGQGKVVPIKGLQLKPKVQLKVEMKAQPKPQRIVNPPRAESPVWKDLKPLKGQYKTDAKNEKVYDWDPFHNEIEVYAMSGGKRKVHLGTIDPVTGKMIKPAVPGRTIEL